MLRSRWTGLISVTIPGSVTDFGDYAFYECSNLTSVTIPGSVTNMGDRSMAAPNWQSVTIDNGVASVSADILWPARPDQRDDSRQRHQYRQRRLLWHGSDQRDDS